MKIKEVKENVEEFMSRRTYDVLDDHGGSFGFINNDDLLALRDEINKIIEINEAISECKSVSCIREVLLKYYEKDEVEIAIKN
jgi:hypothetical protein